MAAAAAAAESRGGEGPLWGSRGPGRPVMEDELYLENIDEFVTDQNRVVTYKWLSFTLGVHVNQAKQMLYDYIERKRKENAGAPLHVTYLLAGNLVQNGHTYHKVAVVREDKLEAMKSKFSTLASVHVYSIQKAQLRDSSPLFNTDYDILKANLENCSKLRPPPPSRPPSRQPPQVSPLLPRSTAMHQARKASAEPEPQKEERTAAKSPVSSLDPKSPLNPPGPEKPSKGAEPANSSSLATSEDNPPEPAQKPLPQPAPAPVEASVGAKRRKRKRVLKSRTFVDDEGCIVTEKAYESESCTESEEDLTRPFLGPPKKTPKRRREAPRKEGELQSPEDLQESLPERASKPWRDGVCHTVGLGKLLILKSDGHWVLEGWHGAARRLEAFHRRQYTFLDLLKGKLLGQVLHRCRCSTPLAQIGAQKSIGRPSFSVTGLQCLPGNGEGLIFSLGGGGPEGKPGEASRDASQEGLGEAFTVPRGALSRRPPDPARTCFQEEPRKISGSARTCSWKHLARPLQGSHCLAHGIEGLFEKLAVFCSFGGQGLLKKEAVDIEGTRMKTLLGPNSKEIKLKSSTEASMDWHNSQAHSGPCQLLVTKTKNKKPTTASWEYHFAFLWSFPYKRAVLFPQVFPTGLSQQGVEKEQEFRSVLPRLLHQATRKVSIVGSVLALTVYAGCLGMCVRGKGSGEKHVARKKPGAHEYSRRGVATRPTRGRAPPGPLMNMEQEARPAPPPPPSSRREKMAAAALGPGGRAAGSSVPPLRRGRGRRRRDEAVPADDDGAPETPARRSGQLEAPAGEPGPARAET
ncbi:hypothetical protein E2320_005673 [Naja naja]|nr:hypothetical protein E2320_005673 [Naja naja]